MENKENARSRIERFVKESLYNETETVTVYPWMYNLGLNSTEMNVYAYLFNRLKHNPYKEMSVPSIELQNKFMLSRSRVNGITQTLHKKELIFKRVDGAGMYATSYYSLYPNLLNTRTDGNN